MLDGVLICTVVVLFVATRVTWLRFFAMSLSLISASNRLNDKAPLSRRIATFGFAGLFQMIVGKEHKYAWLGFGKAFGLAAISFMALMGTAFLLMPPNKLGCRMSAVEWKQSLGHRIACVRSSNILWSK